MTAPSFKVMLAASQIPTPDQLKFPLYASFKLDGIRSPIINGTAYSRKMIALPNLFYQNWVQANALVLEGIDCEVIVGAAYGDGVFNRTTSGIMAVGGEPDFRIYVFDAFFTGGNTLPAGARCDKLNLWYDDLSDTLKSRVVLVEQRLIHNITELQLYMGEALLKGFEGLILKKPDNLYKNGRSTINEGTLLKWKEFVDAEATVLFLKQGKTNNNVKTVDALGHSKRSTHKGNMALTNICGGFCCWSKEFGEFDVGVGSMTNAEAKALWDDRLAWQYTGRQITFKYQPYGVLQLPRFPGWKGERFSLDMGEDL
jgi:DNA ligase-1